METQLLNPGSLQPKRYGGGYMLRKQRILVLKLPPGKGITSRYSPADELRESLEDILSTFHFGTRNDICINVTIIWICHLIQSHFHAEQFFMRTNNVRVQVGHLYTLTKTSILILNRLRKSSPKIQNSSIHNLVMIMLWHFRISSMYILLQKKKKEVFKSFHILPITWQDWGRCLLVPE